MVRLRTIAENNRSRQMEPLFPGVSQRLVVLFQHQKVREIKHTALRTIRRVNLGYYLSETVLNTNRSGDWNSTNHVPGCAYTWSAPALNVLISAIVNRKVWLENNSSPSVTMPMPQLHP